jgi:hypothetical protein
MAVPNDDVRDAPPQSAAINAWKDVLRRALCRRRRVTSHGVRYHGFLWQRSLGPLDTNLR